MDGRGPLLAEVFREAHSLKGAARAVNMEGMGTLAHRLETLFGRVQAETLRFTPAVFDLCHEALDAIGALLADGAADVAGVAARLEGAGRERERGRGREGRGEGRRAGSGGTRKRENGSRGAEERREPANREPPRGMGERRVGSGDGAEGQRLRELEAPAARRMGDDRGSRLRRLYGSRQTNWIRSWYGWASCR